MEGLPSDWRVVDGPTPERSPRSSRPDGPGIAGRWWPFAVAAGIALALTMAAGFLWLTTPSPEVVFDTTGSAIVDGQDASPPPLAGLALPAPTGLPSASPTDIVVDVEGAVARPGLLRLPNGSRVGDAIAGAGGFSPRVDAVATAHTLNLAQPLADGDKVHVPELGAPMPSTVAPTSPAVAPAGDVPATGIGGLVDINHADGPALETLPGIGPVTASKILEARTQQPFARVDELRARGVVGEATFEKIRELVAVTP